jgi:hypothetical protein
MIRIGLNGKEKDKTVSAYLSQNPGIKKVYCLYFKRFPQEYTMPDGVEIEYVEYAQIIKYKVFYRLLEEIGEHSLIVVDECMRTQKRSELTYNCAHKYLKQTPHRIVFEFFPIIEQKDDFMILMDFNTPLKYHGRGFDYAMLKDEDIEMKPFRIRYSTVSLPATAEERERYEAKKKALFAELGNKDPDTVPRTLQLLAGDIKARAVEPDKLYAARNSRHNRKNIIPYGSIDKSGAYVILDFHHRRLNFNDFLKVAGNARVTFLCTDLPVDDVYSSEFIKWKARLDAVYARANLCQ